MRGSMIAQAQQDVVKPGAQDQSRVYGCNAMGRFTIQTYIEQSDVEG